MSAKPYSEPFVITEAVSNNAFNFERRQNEQNSLPLLYVTDLITINFSELRNQDFRQIEAGTKTVFEDFDGDGSLISCKGLKHFIATELPGKIPLYIFDNHNHAFYFWQSEKIKGGLEDGTLLVHFDQHKDSRMPEIFLNKEQTGNEHDLCIYTNTVLNVGNFIPAAQKSGLVGQVVNIDSSEALSGRDATAEFSMREGYASADKTAVNPGVPRRNLILDIDLDFFAPEMDYIDNQSKLAAIKRLIPLANVITIATSPFFIEQGLAIYWLKRILG